MNNLVISCPVSNRRKYLPYYLEHLRNIDFDRSKIHLYFLVNNSTDNSLRILNEFKSKHKQDYASIKIDIFNSKQQFTDSRTTNVRLSHTYNHLSACRNKILQSATELKNVSHLLSIDSDIMFAPDILTKLLSRNVDVVAGIIYNGHFKTPTEPWRFPNIMRRLPNGNFEHIANSYVKNAPTLQESKLLQVDLTGAVVLMSRDVFTQTSYGFHTQGEDAFWSIDCANKGFKLYADCSCFSAHCMDEKLLKKHFENCDICRAVK